MPERIVKNKRKSLCRYCGRDITTDYKVRHKYDEREKHSRYYHLGCYYRHILRSINQHKEELRGLHKSKRKLKKYERHIILERLE